MSQAKISLIYNPGRLEKKELIESFVVRTKIFNEIFQDIKSSEMIHPEQHYIIQGVRGQGKTTLLLRIAYEIMNDSDLNKKLIPIVFNEEQYHITKLYKLWESIAEQLEDMEGFKGLSNELEGLEEADDYEYLCFEAMGNRLKNASKKIIVFIDNIDEMLSKFSDKELHRLREIFIQSAEIRIIGASSTMLEFHHDYGKPFYQFFKMPVLKGLDVEETRTLLLGLGEHYKKDHVKEILEKQPGRIETLRRLTGGVIRTIIILFEIFMDDDNGSAFQDLEKILDGVTALYKHRMESLPVQQQEIVDFIALSWDAVTVKEIAAKTRLKSNAISSQLNQLEKHSIIEKEKTSTKNHLYRIHERFFNIWYLMRHGRKKDERRVRFLVEFLQTWCDHDQLEHRADRHIRALEKGLMGDRHAYLMTNALIRTGLSNETRYKLLESTTTCLENKCSELCEDIPELYMACSDMDLAEHKKYIETLLKKTELDPKELNALGIHAISCENDVAKAEKYFLEASKHDDADTFFNLGILYHQEYKDFEKAEKYYLMAIEKDNTDAMYNLALLYLQERKEIEKVEKYFLMSIERGHHKAMNNLALLYEEEYKDSEKAEKYYLMAIEKGDTRAMNNLAFLYKKEYKDFEKAEMYYLMAIEKSDAGAINNLSFLYKEKHKDFEKIKKNYLMDIEKVYTSAIYNLALLYEEEYKDFEKAEKYYLMAIEKNDTHAMNTLAWSYFINIKKREEALIKSQKAYKKEQNLFISHTFAMILLWHNRIDEAVRVAEDFIEDQEVLNTFNEDVMLYLLLLIAKNQYNLALKQFNENPNNFKDRFKPVYYALMYFMRDEFPNEYLKMGDEIKDTVEEIILKIKKMREDYA